MLPPNKLATKEGRVPAGFRRVQHDIFLNSPRLPRVPPGFRRVPLCQATLSRHPTSSSWTPVYARLHHRVAEQHPQELRPMPGYIIARHSSILSNPGLCQATSSRGTASFSAKPAYAKLHHREAQQHPQQPRPMPGYIIARRSFFLSNPSLCQATSSRGTTALPKA